MRASIGYNCSKTNHSHRNWGRISIGTLLENLGDHGAGEGRKLGFNVENSGKEDIHFIPLHFDL
jgi:hypothetical protein